MFCGRPGGHEKLFRKFQIFFLVFNLGIWVKWFSRVKTDRSFLMGMAAIRKSDKGRCKPIFFNDAENGHKSRASV